MGGENESLDALGDAISAVAALIEHFDGDGVIIGGVAVGMLTTPRFTADVDATLLQRDRTLDHLVEVPSAFGLQHRSANPVAMARNTRMMLLRHIDTDVLVDISLGALPFEQDMVGASVVKEIRGVRVRLPQTSASDAHEGVCRSTRRSDGRCPSHEVLSRIRRGVVTSKPCGTRGPRRQARTRVATRRTPAHPGPLASAWGMISLRSPRRLQKT